MADSHEWLNWLVAIGAIVVPVGCVFLVWVLSRGDRGRDELVETVKDTFEDVTDIKAHLKVKTGYRPITR